MSEGFMPLTGARPPMVTPLVVLHGTTANGELALWEAMPYRATYQRSTSAPSSSGDQLTARDCDDGDVQVMLLDEPVVAAVKLATPSIAHTTPIEHPIEESTWLLLLWCQHLSDSVPRGVLHTFFAGQVSNHAAARWRRLPGL